MMTNRYLRKREFRCLIMLYYFYAAGTAAELTIIYDSGDTRPMAPYLNELKQQAASEAHLDNTPLMPVERLGPAAIENLLPIRSPGLSPGPLLEKAVAKPILKKLAQGNPRPFFLIGSDRLSQRWLAAHRAKLQRLGAVGLLVQAATTDEVATIADIAQGLPITLGSAGDIAKALGVHHYPVLIYRGRIEQ